MVKKDKSALSKVKFEVGKLNYNHLKAPKEYQEAQSGKEMYDSLNIVNNPTSFVINGNEVSARNILSKVQRSNSNENDYLSSLTEAFRKIFEGAGAKTPNESILKELITSGHKYESFVSMNALLGSNLSVKGGHYKKMHINCSDSNCVELKINSEGAFNICDEMVNPLPDSLVSLSSSLEFKLKAKNEEVEYTDGKLSLTLTPKSMEVEQDRSLFSKLVEAIKALLYKAFGKENVKEIKHDFKFYEPKSIINGPQVENINSKSPNIH
ncbi:MAG: hypothetical protein sL5_10140 [Candidatus Mesenet longicola]|uniref:Uncharacterized protein n=1 Tax=Candidatus Mesenet longicola TaxID=1892558 RepID=A0A8J3HQI7_9RICK|nr:MAG: hypothetical protein sGL2_10740 [Candidatus Mesenet longicola]GHM60021.1 MAG: hypothetical protein sL5_10140 [Candidatus Mesenet longicola]